jgi:hypothetical protein
VHYSNRTTKIDPNSFRVVGTADKIAFNGEWSHTIQVKGGDPVQQKGYFSSIRTREGDAWKIWMSAYNRTPPLPAPAETK